MSGTAKHTTATLTVLMILAALTAAAGSTAGAAPTTCFGEQPTIEATPGEPTTGTAGRDVIVGTSGPDVINGRGGPDLICSRNGNDEVRGGAGADRIDLGSGHDTAWGGPGRDVVRGKSGRDVIAGNKGRDLLLGGKGHDTCRGGAGSDKARMCETIASLSEDVTDTFAGTGRLRGYTTNNASALPEVRRVQGRYRAAVTDNSDNVTLHFNDAQGRLDAKRVEFPFDVVVRNIGIGTLDDSQQAPVPIGNPYVFAGVQVHVNDLDDRDSSHVVVGHRGGTHFTIEGKNTVDGDSSVNDAGANVAPEGRADIRIVGSADRTLTVYWQTPVMGSGPDSWTLYNGTGRLPGGAPSYGKSVYIGLITYAFEQGGLPFVGTADAIENNAAT